MHAVLLTLMALAAGNDAPPVYQQASACNCADCGGGGASHRDVRRAMKSIHNMMPQTCYDPVYGCYRGSRFMNRYPAFHGTYYRRPYNYRNMFDYPWHAEPHEPTSVFSFDLADHRQEAAPAPPADLPGRAAPVGPAGPQPSEAGPTEADPQPVASAFNLAPIGTGIREATPVRPASSARRPRNRYRR